MNQEIISEAGEQKGIAFVACAGHAAVSDRFAACASCAEAVQKGFRRGECKSGCVGIGSCIASCKQGALSVEDGKIVVDAAKCDGCGDCAKEGVCPQKLIRIIPRDASNFIPCSSTEEDDDVVRATCGYGCIACGACERACPEGAVHIIENHAVIDYDKCVGCAACAVKCKKKIIVDTAHDLTKLKEKVAFVLCSGGARAKAVFDQLGITDCEAASHIPHEEYQLCTTSCCGLGKCVSVCRYGALSIVNGTAAVDADKCVGCRDCTFACPQHLIIIAPYKGMKGVPCSSVSDYINKSTVCDYGCVACGDCIDNCPNGAIYMESQHAQIDPARCVDCKICQYVCARSVIRELKVPEYIFLQRAILDAEEGDVQ